MASTAGSRSRTSLPLLLLCRLAQTEKPIGTLLPTDVVPDVVSQKVLTWHCKMVISDCSEMTPIQPCFPYACATEILFALSRKGAVRFPVRPGRPSCMHSISQSLPWFVRDRPTLSRTVLSNPFVQTEARRPSRSTSRPLSQGRPFWSTSRPLP